MTTPKRYDKELKTARERYHAPMTQIALRGAILEVPGSTNFDMERIIDQLAGRLGEFKHIGKGKIKQFRTEVISWAKRQARLNVRLREILRKVSFPDQIATMLFLRLPEFTGADEDFCEWVKATAQRDQDGANSLAAWMRECASAVRSGIRTVLSSCCDLEGCIRDVEDQLFSEVWLDVARHPAKFLEFEKAGTLSKKLHAKSKWRARAWKTARLRALDKGANPKPVPGGFEDVESELAYLREQGKCPPRPIVLGPGDTSELGHGHEERMRLWAGSIDLSELHNPIVIPELPWTDADLGYELRRAGPFRADDVYEVDEGTLMAA